MHAKTAAVAAVLIVAAVGVNAARTPDKPVAKAAVEGTPAPHSAAPHSEGPRTESELIATADGRRLYVECTGSGSPTVVIEAGDGETSASYDFAVPAVSDETRTCVYDRANLGNSDSATGPRGLTDLVGDLEQVLVKADAPEPYVLVGRSGGGDIVAGYAYEHPASVAGMVLIDTATPFLDPPPEVVAKSSAKHPSNIEQRDYRQVTRDAWNARKEIGEIPMTVVSVVHGDNAESAGERANAMDQRGWLVLSPESQQIIAETGPAVEEDDPEFVIDVIIEVVRDAR